MTRLQPVSHSSLFTAAGFRAPQRHHCIVAKRATTAPVVMVFGGLKIYLDADCSLERGAAK